MIVYFLPFPKYSQFIYFLFKCHFRPPNINTSTSHPLLTFNNNSSRNLYSASRGQSHDKSTQTPENIERETRRHKLRSLKINFNNVPTPSLNFKLSFLNNRKRTNLTANAVATEQKATKVSNIRS